MYFLYLQRQDYWQMVKKKREGEIEDRKNNAMAAAFLYKNVFNELVIRVNLLELPPFVGSLL